MRIYTESRSGQKESDLKAAHSCKLLVLVMPAALVLVRLLMYSLVSWREWKLCFGRSVACCAESWVLIAPRSNSSNKNRVDGLLALANLPASPIPSPALPSVQVLLKNHEARSAPEPHRSQRLWNGSVCLSAIPLVPSSLLGFKKPSRAPRGNGWTPEGIRAANYSKGDKNISK